jgi:hypothetical protein
MGSLFLLAFGSEVFFASLATAGSEAFFNKLLVGIGAGSALVVAHKRRLPSPAK